MILQPAIPVILIVVFGIALLGFAIWQLVVAAGRAARLSWALRLVLVVLLLIIAARPVIPATHQGPSASGGLEVYFVVDTTSSVSAQDWGEAEPRLAGIRQDISTIVDELGGAQYALITFDVDAVQRVPLTTDASAILNAAEVLTPEVSYYSRGSSISEAVGLLTTILDEAAQESPDQERVVFYLGDGEQTVSAPPESFEPLSSLVSGGAVLGYGTAAGGRMLQFDGFGDEQSEIAYILDYSVSPPVEAISRIDETALTTIADQLGVNYYKRTASEPVSAALRGIDVGELSVADGEPGSPIELYWIFAIPFGLIALFEAARIALVVLELRSSRKKTS
ncbi:MAG: VWA domain-containing protein [Microbacteriaceae bacterium]